jgi:hypothetical protein
MRRKSFWGPALLTFALVVVLKFFHFDASIPFLDHLLANQDPSGIIAWLVLSVTLFCLLRLLLWHLVARKELQLIRWAQQRLQNPQTYQQVNSSGVADPLADIQKTFAQYSPNSALKKRIQLAQQQPTGLASEEHILSLIGSHSSIDDSHLHNTYGPMRALIWALPAFGFMGTAFEMAGAIGGLGTALSQTQNYNGLRNLLVNQIVPHLASAFNITIFALGCSVVCFILLSWVHAGEQTSLLEADGLSLEILKYLRNQQSLPSGPSTLPTEIQTLIWHLQVLNTKLTGLQQSGGIGSLIPLVSGAKETLEAIRQNLEQDITISRSPRLQKMGGQS